MKTVGYIHLFLAIIILTGCTAPKLNVYIPKNSHVYSSELVSQNVNSNENSHKIEKTSPPKRPLSKVALIIGNSSYKIAPLANPINDAVDINNALEGLGFKTIKLIDADKKEIIEAINHFGEELQTSDIGLFYFAGHGLQVKGDNYLIPINSNINSESDIEFEGVNVSRLLGKMDKQENKINIVMLDACRNNPFARSFRSMSRGLSRVDAPTGTFVVFSTAPGEVAQDGDGKNGVFTKHLLRHIKTPNLPIEEVMKKVRVSVMQETDKKQVPWQSSSLTGSFYFLEK